MKKIISTLFSLVFTIVIFAQQAPPQGINYQAMVYVPYGNQQVGVNSAGQIPANYKEVVVKFTLEEGNNGPVIYEETHIDTTDQYGLLNTVIGTGTPTSNSPGLFNQIDWSLGDPYLRVSITLTQYNSTVSSYQKLWSVPYALYSDQANTADSAMHSVYADSAGYSFNSAYADSSHYADLAGNGITGVTDNGDGTLTFTYYDGSSYTTSVLTGLMGAQGPQGPQGAQGPAGQNGTNGQSAYDIWLAQGNTGTQQDFLNSLQGFLPPGTQVGNTTYWDGTNWVVSSNNIYNNGSAVSIGTNSVDASAILNISSNDRGILIPRVTLTQRNAISNPTNGLLIYQTDNTPGFYYYDGTNWVGMLNTNSNLNTNGSANSLIYTVNGF